jgi:hypothetical protein
MVEEGERPSFVTVFVLLGLGALLNALLVWAVLSLWDNGGLRVLFAYPVVAIVYGLPLAVSYLRSAYFRQMLVCFVALLPIIYFVAVIVTMIAGVFSYSESDGNGLLDWADPIYGAVIGSAASLLALVRFPMASRFRFRVVVVTIGVLALISTIAAPLVVTRYWWNSNYFSGLPANNLEKAIGFPFLWQLVFAFFAALLLQRRENAR